MSRTGSPTPSVVRLPAPDTSPLAALGWRKLLPNRVELAVTGADEQHPLPDRRGRLNT